MTTASTTPRMPKDGREIHVENNMRKSSKCALFKHLFTNFLTCPSKSNLPDPERVLYTALAPCPQTFSTLKSACRTWEDHLWAQISILCEEKQMITLGGGFCDGDLEDAAGEEEWEREATSTLETLGRSWRTGDMFPPQTMHSMSLSWPSSSIGQLDSGMETSILNHQSKPEQPAGTLR
ncbi:hypothetical protein F4604DRAFT_1748506 [Suillus subluteus]|nr:hypothetical protein F4604DRAFT_1748506 [Suillus subluteus]